MSDLFTGFKIEYPEYTVVTPQSGLFYGIRALNVGEADRLKNSITIPSKATDIINQVIWGSLITKPKFIKDYEQWKKETTLRDRESLMFGLYMTSFPEERDFDLKCSKCGEETTLNLNIENMLEFIPYPGCQMMKEQYRFARATDPYETPADMEMEQHIAKEKISKAKKTKKKEEDDAITFIDDVEDEKEENIEIKEEVIEETENPTNILTERIKTVMPVSKVVAYVKQPTIYEEQEIFKFAPLGNKKNTDLLNETLIIDKFEQYEPGNKKPSMVVSDRRDILTAYQSLPNKDKRHLFDVFKNSFGQYGIELKSNWNCPSCNNENELGLDIVTQFFRMVATN